MSGDDLNQQSSKLAARIVRDVLRPFEIEHQAGLHGPADAARCSTITMCGLIRALVPGVAGSVGPEQQRGLIAELTAMLDEEVTLFRGCFEGKSGMTVQ